MGQDMASDQRPSSPPPPDAIPVEKPSSGLVGSYVSHTFGSFSSTSIRHRTVASDHASGHISLSYFPEVLHGSDTERANLETEARLLFHFAEAGAKSTSPTMESKAAPNSVDIPLSPRSCDVDPAKAAVMTAKSVPADSTSCSTSLQSTPRSLPLTPKSPALGFGDKLKPGGESMSISFLTHAQIAAMGRSVTSITFETFSAPATSFPTNNEHLALQNHNTSTMTAHQLPNSYEASTTQSYASTSTSSATTRYSESSQTSQPFSLGSREAGGSGYSSSTSMQRALSSGSSGMDVPVMVSGTSDSNNTPPPTDDHGPGYFSPNAQHQVNTNGSPRVSDPQLSMMQHRMFSPHGQPFPQNDMHSSGMFAAPRQQYPVKRNSGDYMSGTQGREADSASQTPKRYKCKWAGCEMSFKTSGHLARHKKVHTGAKPHE
ncbi:hypothetical protein M427DRAFT_482872 [Gonapodya prolifera JEL478]|uniref:C2H2-type domain-containing protein n=1 Tax=Gonapodya prolifera (strain JEL478) TaxID=1344416 RepID=A0A139A0Y4_GONPJ|nr:hypothetical protein M427DRAFT_482872 [Gonapodya prolifera JEL478]|eukprot:KXS10384.1 hypothetical protein M427DRAFT_482872 [Gonapodya prolifera JEL478]